MRRSSWKSRSWWQSKAGTTNTPARPLLWPCWLGSQRRTRPAARRWGDGLADRTITTRRRCWSRSCQTEHAPPAHCGDCSASRTRRTTDCSMSAVRISSRRCVRPGISLTSRPLCWTAERLSRCRGYAVRGQASQCSGVPRAEAHRSQRLPGGGGGDRRSAGALHARHEPGSSARARRPRRLASSGRFGRRATGTTAGHAGPLDKYLKAARL
jgi:hypothetical protein